MKKFMFLVEVYDCNNVLFKRRISDNITSIEEWLDDVAQNWVLLPIEVEHDGYGNGKVVLAGNHDIVVYTFSTHNIGFL